MIEWDHVIELAGTEMGALVVYPLEGHTTTTFTLKPDGRSGQKFHVNVTDHKSRDGKTIYAAIFPSVPPGNYVIVREPEALYGAGFWNGIREALFSAYEKKVSIFVGNIACVQFT